MSENIFSSSSQLASFADGYNKRGGFFYIADCAIIIDYSVRDGVVDQVCQGSKHVHGTVRGQYSDGFTRLWSSGQINRTLQKQVQNYLLNPDCGKCIMDDRQRFKAGRDDIMKARCNLINGKG